MWLKVILTLCLLGAVCADHEDDTIEDFSRLMHESSDEAVSELSKSELKEKLKLILEDIDSDDDDVIEREELLKWVQEAEMKVTKAEAEEDIDEMDKDGDNAVSWQEYEEANEDDSEEELEFAKQLFEIADADDDGELNEEEFIRFSNPEDDDELRPIMAKRITETLDKDGDNKLSYDELRKIAGKKVFDGDDENDDGFIDAEELDEILDDDFEEEELVALLKVLIAADDDQDGKLTIEELLEEPHLFKDTPILTYGLELFEDTDAQRDEL